MRLSYSFLIIELVAVALGLVAVDFARAETPPVADGPCMRWDRGCRRRMIQVMTGTNFAQVEVDGGVRFGDGFAQAAVRVRAEGVDVDMPFGDARIIPFEAIYVPGENGIRLRVSLAESDVLFFCRDLEGNTRPPVTGFLLNGCEPTGVVGIGGRVAEIQWDTERARVAARWAELNFIVNFLRNGNSDDYINHRLMAYIGASADTIFPGDTGGDIRTMARLNMGITGMFRTEDSKWEIRGFAGYRPNVVAWDDYAIEARATVMRNLLLGEQLVGQIGAEASYTRWSVPGNSMGAFTSLTEQDTGFVGLIFGLRWH